MVDTCYMNKTFIQFCIDAERASHGIQSLSQWRDNVLKKVAHSSVIESRNEEKWLVLKPSKTSICAINEDGGFYFDAGVPLKDRDLLEMGEGHPESVVIPFEDFRQLSPVSDADAELDKLATFCAKIGVGAGMRALREKSGLGSEVAARAFFESQDDPRLLDEFKALLIRYARLEQSALKAPAKSINEQ